MADAVVSAVAEQMTTILKEQIQNEVSLVSGVENEIDSLSKELENIRNKLEDAEKKQFADTSMRAWLVRLEEASYKMEDVLDEWHTALHKSRIQQQQQSNDAPKNKVCSFVSCLCFQKVVVGLDMAIKIKNVKSKLNVILEEKDRYGLVTSISSIDLAEVHGRDIDRDVVASKIFMTASPSHVGTEERQLETVSIVGVGGVGKTTLAQLIFNDNRVKDCFELSVWICVSDPFDEVMIAKKIIMSVSGRSPEFNQLEVLVLVHLKAFISGKKLLLVLDDVWTEDHTKWELLKNSLKSCCGIDSRILVITRKEKVAKALDTLENGIHLLGVLSGESCWLLMKRIALFGRDEEECAKYKENGVKILDKCKGLPLAVKTLGSLLGCKNNNGLEEWENVLKSEIWDLEEAQVDIFPHLLLSYNELSPILKHCFSYCAVFPKDYEIEVGEVIGHWMALGYLGYDIESGVGDMELRGRQYFDNLAMPSLFQDFTKDYSSEGDKIKSFKLHDIVRDFAQFVRKNIGSVVGDEEDENTLADIEEGQLELSPPSLPLPLLLQQSSSEKQQQNPKNNYNKIKNKPTTTSRLSVILLDQGLFTVYKRMFIVCMAINVIGILLAATGNFPYARTRPALFSIANVFLLVLYRSEAFLRLVFWLSVAVLGHPWVPLRIKTAATSHLQSLGGVHSGCGVSSIAWLVYALILTLKDRETSSPAIIVTASTIIGLLCLCSLAAFPLLRHLHHNVFERTHRFAGWTATALVWAFVTLQMLYDPLTKSYRDRTRLVKSQELWFTVGITVLIIIPWLTVRKVKVQVSSPSGHAAIIKFAGGVKPGILGRISPSPFSEWHAFGIISDGEKEHTMLAGAVGDFTRSLVSSPPTHLWVRRVHFAGLPYLTNMYDRVLLVATGSGICVFLSFLLQPCAAEVCVLWVTKNVEQNFGTEIKQWTSGDGKGNNKVIVHDTAVLGRPNVSELSVEAARDFGAEVVIVTSNPEGSRDVVNACKAAGFPAFGPIWDS